jgi:foldase protein PrsA
VRHVREVLALCAFFVLPIVLSACGSVPGNSVAQVGDQEISKDQFEHWVKVVANGSAQQTPGQKAVVPDPPNYTKCIAALRKSTPKPAKGQPKPTTETFRKQCKQQYTLFRNQAENFLIQSVWLQGEAADRKINVTDAQVEKRLKQVKKQNFPKAKEFTKFLKDSGQTLEDIRLQVKLDVISTKIKTQVTKGADKVSQAKVAAFYAKNRTGQFTTPERRDILLVLASSKAKAQAALAALKSGRSWKAVAKRYSTDPQTKTTGGLLVDASQSDQDKTFGAAAFSAPKGKLRGPVKSEFGYYVFEVRKVTPKKTQALKDVQSQIRAQLIDTQKTAAVKRFVDSWQAKWWKKTDCRAGFRIQGCKQKPKPKPQPAQQQQQQSPAG